MTGDMKGELDFVIDHMESIKQIVCTGTSDKKRLEYFQALQKLREVAAFMKYKKAFNKQLSVVDKHLLRKLKELREWQRIYTPAE